jgi:hypothetical protein
MQNGGFHLPVPSFFAAFRAALIFFSFLISNCRANASTR